MTIVYLMLKNNQAIKPATIRPILPSIRSDVFKTMIEKLINITGFDIDKNEVNSYVLIDDI